MRAWLAAILTLFVAISTVRHYRRVRSREALAVAFLCVFLAAITLSIAIYA